MSLLLQALQKAAKSREEGEVDLQVDALSLGDELSLEPSPSRPHAQQEISASPTSAQAAMLVQAASMPGFDPMDYAREHYMLAIAGGAIIAALGYGIYVYLQLNSPFRSPPPAAVVVTAPAPPAPATIAAAPQSAKISGLPGAETAAPVGTSAATAMFAESTAASSASAAPTIPSAPDLPVVRAPKKASSGVKPIRSTAMKPQRPPAESQVLGDAGDSIETVVIPASRSKPADDISVRHDAAGVVPISPTLIQAYESLQSGDNARAKVLYEQVLQADARNVDALLGLAAIALSDSRTEDASRYYQRVLELEPRNSYAQAGLISIVGGADLQASESRLKQLIAREPSAFLYFSLGNLYAEQAQWPYAQQAYYQAYQMQQDNPDYAFNLAIGLEHIGQNQLALNYYRKALDLSFKKGHANFDQSLVIQRVGQLSTRVPQ
ncbi:MAG: tetratricopeptide repeat protein [Betaproteobacteria bacterium]|jgi:tetratricopeptide (TPR) repeat protein